MIELTRATDALSLNALVNDPSIYPMVCGDTEGVMDLTPIVANPFNHVLTAEHGAVVFAARQVGLYEMTATVLPAWRGAWAMEMVREALEWVFTHTGAVEVYVRAPEVDLAALPFAKALGFTFEFVSPRGWIYEGEPVPAAILSLKVQDWMRSAPGLNEAAEAFHASMAREFVRSGMGEYPMASDETRDRYIGAAIKMLWGGQAQKGVIFYDRFAAMMGHPPIALCGVDPIILDIGGLRFEAHGKSLFLVSPASDSVN